MFSLAKILYRHWRQTLQSKIFLDNRNQNFKDEFSKIKESKGIIVVCSNCGKILDNDGCWHEMECCFPLDPKAQFSHGICPVCMEKYYFEFFDHGNKDNNHPDKPRR